MKQINILLKSNGKTKRIITDKKMSISEYTDILDCDYIDIKGLKLDELNISLVFDEEFLFTDKAINKKASLLFGYKEFGYKEHSEVLCGDVLVQKDIETPEGIIAVGFNEEEATVIETYIENLKYEHIKFIKQEPCVKFIPF